MGGRNIKKGDPKYEAICPLCLHNNETQAHILLRCCHPAMKYWREEYFAKCTKAIKEQKDPVLEKYLGGLWEWIATPLDEEDQKIIDMDSRRVALMMGRPIREDLERPGSQTHLTADQIQKMQKAMLELWQTSLEFAVTTWRTRGRLRSTPDKVNEWYKIGPITEEVMRGCSSIYIGEGTCSHQKTHSGPRLHHRNGKRTAAKGSDHRGHSDQEAQADRKHGGD
jgi:hypothetical protein